MIEEVTFDETCVNLDDIGEKKYHNKCEDCDFVVNASKKICYTSAAKIS